MSKLRLWSKFKMGKTANNNTKSYLFHDALESVMCDVIKIRLKRRIAARSGEGNQPLNIKTAVERPIILKLRLPNFMWGFYFILLLVASLLFGRIFMTSETFQCFLFHLLQDLWLKVVLLMTLWIGLGLDNRYHHMH